VSAELSEYAVDRGQSWGMFSGGSPFDPREYDKNEFKNVPTANLAARLSKAWKNVDRKEGWQYWKIPRNVLAELARRPDKDAVAVLISDFEQHIEWYTEMLYHLVAEWCPKYDNDLGWDYSWAYPHKTTEYYWPLYKNLARDSTLPTAMASRLVEKVRDGKIKGDGAIAGIMPLGFLKTKESRQLLVRTAQLKDPAAAFTAAKCLLIRNDPLGKDALINVILTHRRRDLPPDKTGDTFTRMLESKDAAILPRFKKAYFRNPHRVTGQHREFNAYDEEGRGWPIRLIATLAKLDQKQASVYEAFIAELGKPEQRPDNGDWSKVTGGYNAEALIEASEIYYRPIIGKQLAAALEDIGYERIATELIAALVKTRATDCVQALTKQLNRPTPLEVKTAIIEASAKVDIPGLPEKLTEWSTSRNKQLARLAKTAIARRKKMQ